MLYFGGSQFLSLIDFKQVNYNFKLASYYFEITNYFNSRFYLLCKNYNHPCLNLMLFNYQSYEPMSL